MELNSVEAIIELVRQGLGYSIIPKLANIAWSSDRQLKIQDLPGKTVYRRVGLLERKKHGRQNITQVIKKKNQSFFLEISALQRCFRQMFHDGDERRSQFLSEEHHGYFLSI